VISFVLLSRPQLFPRTIFSQKEKKEQTPIDEKSIFRQDCVLLVAVVAQLVRALDCGSKSRGFESRRSPILSPPYSSKETLVTILDALILGIVQGLTEFLPVSSSGHLKLFQSLLGLQQLDHYILFDLVCHLGTLLAIVLIFFQQIKSAALFQNSTRFWQIVIGTLPLFPLVLIMKPIKAIYADPSYLGFFFIVTAIILFLGIRFGKTLPPKEQDQHPWRDAFCIGLWQAFAIFPGVSRSGSTISGARLLGWIPQDAVTFSFLLAIPAILGGVTLEFIKWWQHPELTVSIPLTHYLTGFLFSFFVGFFSLKALMRFVVTNRLSYFAWYCLILGLATTYYFHIYSPL
jgi:undecaprenyl-diphosphatase